jgi:endonuclease-3 related protein
MLLNEYGYQYWWPIVDHEQCLYLEEYTKRERTEEEILEIMVGAILTQNTAWDNVVKALKELKKKKILEKEVLKEIVISELSETIRASGYYNQKAKKIKELVNSLSSIFQNQWMKLKSYSLEEARNLLLSIWGVGKETADSVLLYAYGFPLFVVDSYTKRIFYRLGFLNENTLYDEAQTFFHDHLKLDKRLFQEYHALIVEFGKKICKSRPLCNECFLKVFCNFAKLASIDAH